jgi:hypothetical protein
MSRLTPVLVVAALLFFNSCDSNREKLVGEQEENETEQDRVDLALQQDFRMRRDPRLDYIPVERLETAKAYMQSLVTARNIAALSWQERGPNNVGGRTRAMIIDRRDATGNTVIAASVAGGMFRTTNYTSPSPTWTVINDFLPNLAIGSMVQDPVNMNIMYAGTGEGWFNIDAVRGRGIYKSTDGGLTWNVLASTVITTPTDISFEYVQDLVIDNNGALYASLRNLVSNSRGVQRSTDGGNSWTQVLGAPLPGFNTGRATDLEVASNGDVYASLGMVGANFANRSVVMKSSFAVHGANTGALGTWVNITPVRGRVTQRTEIILAPSDPQRVYLLMQDSANYQVIGTYRSFTGGSSWDSVASATALNNGGASQTWYNLIGAVDPNNADILVVGGLHIGKSIDAGVSWTTISSGQVHVDHHFLEYRGSNTLYNGNDGGVYYTANATAALPTFSNKNTGYNVTQFYATDYHPTDVNYFLAGAQDNGTQRFTAPGFNTTSSAVGGDGGFNHIDQTNPLFQFTATVFNNYYRSTNGGGIFTQLASISNSRGQFINPTDYDDAANILYASDDPGRYYVVSNLEGTPSSLVANISSTIGTRELTAVKVDPFTSNTIWVGASSTGGIPMVVKVTAANTANPTVLNFGNVGTVSGANLSSIDVDPGDANHIIATLSNFGVTSVFESTNGGSTFTPIEGNLPDMPVYWALFAPPNAQLSGSTGGLGGVLLGTDLGVWTTSALSGGLTQWIPNNTGLANVRTDMLKYRPLDNLVVAATHGRGLFTTIIPTVVTGVPNDPVTKNFIKYVFVDNNQLQIIKGNLLTTSMTLQLYDMKGSQVYSGKFPYQNATIPVGSLQKGSYIIRITGNNRENFVKQFILTD